MSKSDDQGGDQSAELPQTTVLARIHELIEAEEIHGITISRRSGDTYYALVASSGENADGWDVFDLRTVVIDLEKETVAATDNGIWIPKDGAIIGAMKQLLTRSWADLNSVDSAESLIDSALEDVDPTALLSETVPADRDVPGQHVDKMRRYTGIDPNRPWGFGAGPPPEIERVIERLEEAGLDPAEHFMRLVFGKKEPIERRISDHTPDRRPVDELKGNYGVELLPRDSGLVAIDVDYPEEFPEGQLPETLEVSSPHGDDSRRHIILRCDEKERLARSVGAWAVQSAPWGDLWIGDRYLVGPGSQLCEYGCGEGEHEVDEAGGCEVCEDPERGFYRIVSDRPIATVTAEEILELLPDGADYELRDEPTAPDVPEEDLPSVLEGEPDPPDPEIIAEATHSELRGFSASYAEIDPDGLEPSELRERLMGLRNRWEAGVNGEVNGAADGLGENVLECRSCGKRGPPDAMKVLEIDGEDRPICRGGCDE